MSRGADLRWALGGNNLQFYPSFALFSILGGWTSTTIFFRWANKVKRPKKMVLHLKKEKLFSPNSSGDLRSNAHQSQIIGGMRMQTILKLLGGYSQIIGRIYLPIPPSPGFRQPCRWEDETKANKSRRNRFVGNNHQSRGTKQSLATHPPCTQ